MTKHRIVLAALVVPALVVLASAAAAQEQANGRFSMSPTAEGYLKLDSRTGDVTECQRNGDQGYRCTLTPDERSALQAEIDRLAGENVALREAMKSQGLTPPGGGSGSAGARAPSDQEFDRAMTLMERFMRRFMNLMKEETAKPPGAPNPP
jgi:hypothetical protein